MSGLAMGLIGALLVLAGAVGSRLWERAHRPPVPAVTQETATAPGPTSVAADVPPPSLAIPTPPPLRELQIDPNQVPDTDRTQVDSLVRKLANPSSLTAADVQMAEALLSRHTEERAIRDLLEAVLLAAAGRHLQQRQFAQAVAYLQRAGEIQPSSTRAPLALMGVSMDTSDWTGAEAAARAAIKINPRSFEAWQGLGYALLRQDRNRDAVEALRAALEIRDDTNVRGMIQRIEATLANERGMADRRLSHFTVRYDGEEHEAVGREIVRALETHYATLVRTLDYEPTNSITVILFSRQGYYNEGGGPQYLGHYDLLDGRIRVPIGGVTTTLTSQMDGTLLHELTHAFVHERTQGVATRFPIQEGLAQFIEGKRIDAMNPRLVAALASGRSAGEYGQYVLALSFVEYLVASRGQGGINDLLKAMGETGSMDDAFRQVYGMTLGAAQDAWGQRFQRQYGKE
jgi:hypothetical protein